MFKRGMDIYATWEMSALDFEAFFSLRPGFNMSQLWHRRLLSHKLLSNVEGFRSSSFFLIYIYIYNILYNIYI